LSDNCKILTHPAANKTILVSLIGSSLHVQATGMLSSAEVVFAACAPIEIY